MRVPAVDILRRIHATLTRHILLDGEVRRREIVAQVLLRRGKEMQAFRCLPVRAVKHPHEDEDQRPDRKERQGQSVKEGTRASLRHIHGRHHGLRKIRAALPTGTPPAARPAGATDEFTAGRARRRRVAR